MKLMNSPEEFILTRMRRDCERRLNCTAFYIDDKKLVNISKEGALTYQVLPVEDKDTRALLD